jgi:hypothetical protein
MGRTGEHKTAGFGCFELLPTTMRRYLAGYFCFAALAVAVNAQDLSRRFEDFTADPQWESYRSQLLPNPIPITRQDFGARLLETGPTVGGWVQRSLTPAWFGKVIPTRTLTNKLSASGKFAVTNDQGSSGVLFGWFNEKSRGWRTPNSLAFRIDGNTGKYWVFYEYGTRHWLTGGGGCFEGDRYQTTPTKPFRADGTMHTWSLTYDPSAENGRGVMTFVLDGTTYTQPLAPGHKEDGAEFNRFGMFNVQTTGSGMEFYVTAVVLDGQAVDLRANTGWEGRGNKVEFEDRHLRPYHDFGWKRTSKAGSKPGELGGVIWRDEKPAYYASKIGPLTLEDELFASGKISFNGAGSDSGVYFGWFDSRSKTNKETSDHLEPPRNFVAILLEGPSRIGHYFRGAYRTATGDGELDDTGPIIHPDGQVHEWSILYSPHAAGGDGAITVKLDDHSETLPLGPGHWKRGASFDRFGLFNLQVGGHFVDIAIDDLTYTARPTSK